MSAEPSSDGLFTPRTPLRARPSAYETRFVEDSSSDIHSVEGKHPGAASLEGPPDASPEPVAPETASYLDTLKPYLSDTGLESITARPAALEGIMHALSYPRLGDLKLSLPLDAPFICPRAGHQTHCDVPFDLYGREVLANEDSLNFFRDMSNYVSMNIASPNLAYSLYVNAIQQSEINQTNNEVIVLDLRPIERQLDDPLPAAINFWDVLWQSKKGDETEMNLAPVALSTLQLRQGDLSRVDARVLMILPDDECEWLDRDRMRAGYSDTLKFIQSIPSKGRTKLINPKHYSSEAMQATASMISPMHCSALLLLFRAISFKDDFPPFIAMARASWFLDHSIFKYNRYALPPVMYDLPDLGWAFPMEIVPPAVPFFDPRHDSYGCVFIGSLPPLTGLELFKEWLQWRNISSIHILGDGPIPMEVQEILDDESVTSWSKISVPELIRQRHIYVDDFWWQMQDNERILFLEVNSGIIHSSCLAGLCLREWFGLSPQSAAAFIKMRVRMANTTAIRDFIISDEDAKEAKEGFTTGRYHANVILVGDGFENWGEKSSFEDCIKKEMNTQHQSETNTQTFHNMGEWDIDT